MKKKNAFTLVEMLSVVVILGITFMFILPSLTGLFTMGNKTETELIEERVLSAAKEYVNKIDGNFYTKLYKEGDTNYIYKSDLINAGLISEEDVSKLNTFAGVKGEVLKNDRIRYTVEYINASNNEYTNEELYLMMQNMNKKYENILDKVEKIENQGSSGETTTNISLLSVYPVGSIYMSENSISPAELFGGTWVQLKDRFLLGAGDTYTAGSTGGESKHTLTVNEMPSHSHIIDVYHVNTGNFDATYSKLVYKDNLTTTWVSEGGSDWLKNTGGSQPHNNMPPYITVYMWKRTA